MISLFPFSALSQSTGKDKVNLWGYVVDSFLQTGIEGAKVTLMTADSTVVDTVRTYPYDGNALFHFSLPKQSQDIILRAEHEGYESGCVSMKVRTYQRVKDVYAPWVQLKKKSTKIEQHLDDVVVKASMVQFVWKGDTLVYNADAFNVPQGSMLDGLIRQLPGVTLKEDGVILINGRQIDYLTLNGKDFFKGNNKRMLDNLPYYTVKNIKVYDKSSEISEFVGCDVEKADYVMDVVLKREYSVGGMANAELGGGTAERWMSRAFCLRFTDHSRLTVFGNGNNINQTERPGEDGEWKVGAPADGITTHGEVNANLMTEDSKKRWKNELAVTYTDTKNDRQSIQESECHLNGSSEFSYRNNSILAHDRKVDVTNTFTSNKSTAPIYFTSMVGYQYGHNFVGSQDSTRARSDVGSLYRLYKHAKNRSHNHSVFTTNHMLVKLPWGDRLNLRLDGLYNTQRARNFSHYLLEYSDATQPRDLRRRYEPRSYIQYYWQMGAEYVIHLPHDWNVDFGCKYRQSRDADDAPSYRLDRDVAWMQLAPSVDDLPPVLSDGLQDVENSLDIVTQTRRHLFSARIYYIRNTEEAYTNFEVKLPLSHECGHQHYQRGSMDAHVNRNETFFDPSISFTRQLHKRNIYYNASLTAETILPDITNLVGYESHYDPLSITIGNPHIKPQHTFKSAVYFVKNWPQRAQTLYAYLDASVTRNRIIPSVGYDRSTGVYTRCDENINGNWATLSGMTFNSSLDKNRRWHIENALWVTLSNVVWRGQDLSVEQALVQRITTCHIKIDDKAKLSFRASHKFDASLNVGIVHGLSWSNLSSYENMHVSDFSYGLAAHWSLPLSIQISSDLSMLHRSGYESNAMGRCSTVWNAQLAKSFCHDRLALNLICHDILNRTLHNVWSISNEGYTNTSYNSLPRYVILSVIYKFQKKNLKTDKSINRT